MYIEFDMEKKQAKGVDYIWGLILGLMVMSACSQGNGPQDAGGSDGCELQITGYYRIDTYRFVIDHGEERLSGGACIFETDSVGRFPTRRGLSFDDRIIKWSPCEDDSCSCIEVQCSDSLLDGKWYIENEVRIDMGGGRSAMRSFTICNDNACFDLVR